MAELLDSDGVRAALSQLHGWSGDEKQISRSVKAATFAEGIRLVDAVAVVADEMDHHPDIDIRWTTVTFTCATHSKGGVTDADVTLARRIDELASTHNAA
ncbi:MAG TPA: 4a-hydroxytetrahydrobiopterin dehydratase [Acidothermaceae bacterium]|jgi:4a-hydroxytetrahydrobiopterin dehydratase